MDEVQLVLLAQAGDREAFDHLLRGVYPSLFRYTAALVGHTDADDIVQDTAVQIHRKLRWLREPAYFRAWAFRIASRMAVARLKKHRRWESLEDHAELAHEITAAEDFEALLLWNDQIQMLADELSPASRAVLLLHYQQECSLDEIGAVLEIPLGTVKSRLFYAVKMLRKRFAKRKSMSENPLGKPQQGEAESSIRQALDAVDKAQRRDRLLLGLVIVGAVAAAIWFDQMVRNSTAASAEILAGAVGVLVAMLTLITVKLRNIMNKNTRSILRAIGELDSKLKRTS